ncbi:MAG TPA: glycerate kinase [Candidatus Acidoferrales bacterium]|nr:glycerate kinase [Candidatus Acidoferrales bacterium]
MRGVRRGAHRLLSAIPVALCAPNAFKGSLSARAAARAIALGARDAGARTVELPVADGGDGTLDVLLASRPGSSLVRHRVTGPGGRPVTARLGLLDETTAVVELAEASGLRLVTPARMDALHATSRGTGELIRRALDAGSTRIVVGVGGSACTDGGAGLLQALGVRLLDASGMEIGPGGAGLDDLARIDASGVHPDLARCSIDVACDIRSPLLGIEGAARMFAAQKGASASAVDHLERALEHFALVARGLFTRDLARLPGAGAAGGCGFGLALIGARLLPGAALVCDVIGLDAALSGASVAITGEGRLDGQTRVGKAPAEVAARARRSGIPCIAVCGSISDRLPDLFDSALALDELDAGIDPMRHTRALLRRAGATAIRDAFPALSQ